jgi:choline dehydrogenase
LFTKSNSNYTRPNIEFHVQPLSLPKFGEDLDDFNAFTASICNLQPTSRGSIHINSLDVHSKPVISPNYLSTEEDCNVAIESIELTRNIVNQSSFAMYNPIEHKPGSHLVSKDELLNAARGINKY